VPAVPLDRLKTVYAPKRSLAVQPCDILRIAWLKTHHPQMLKQHSQQSEVGA
jgi:hypothetical protein